MYSIWSRLSKESFLTHSGRVCSLNLFICHIYGVIEKTIVKQKCLFLWCYHVCFIYLQVLTGLSFCINAAINWFLLLECELVNNRQVPIKFRSFKIWLMEPGHSLGYVKSVGKEMHELQGEGYPVYRKTCSIR